MSLEDDNLCAFHKERDADITEIKATLNSFVRPKLSKMSGQWRVLLVGISLFGALMGVFVYWMGTIQLRMADSQQSIEENVANMNTVFTANMGVTAQQYTDMVNQLGHIGDTLTDHEMRLRSLERVNITGGR